MHTTQSHITSVHHPTKLQWKAILAIFLILTVIQDAYQLHISHPEIGGWVIMIYTGCIAMGIVAMFRNPALGTTSIVFLGACEIMLPFHLLTNANATTMFVAICIAGATQIAYGSFLAAILACSTIVSIWLWNQESAINPNLREVYLCAITASLLLGIITDCNPSKTSNNSDDFSNMRKLTKLASEDIHNYICNDLTNIIMTTDTINPILLGNDASNHNSIRQIRDLAESALQHARKVIVLLETDNNQETDIKQNRNESSSDLTTILTKTMHKYDTILHTIGFTGESIITPDFPHSISTAFASNQLMPILRELYGNIAKHALPNTGYTVIISQVNDCISIYVADVPSKHNYNGRHTGMSSIRHTVEQFDGICEIYTDDLLWYTHIQIPLNNL